jgi:mxaJ protein
MFSRCLESPALLLLLLVLACAGAAGQPAPLRVCADPDNRPYSARDESGFENRIARMMAQDLGRPLEYTWLLDRRGFVRKTMGAGLCELIIGVPQGYAPVQTTRPYYSSAFFFVSRQDGPAPASFTDPRLPRLRIGVQLIGIDPGTSPVGYALARHGAHSNVVGFTLTEDARPPAERMVDAVARGQLDSALVWGAQAGYYARRSPVALRVDEAQAPPDMAGLPFRFAIAMGVRKGDDELLRTANDFLARRAADIDALLSDYGVLRAGEVQP